MGNDEKKVLMFRMSKDVKCVCVCVCASFYPQFSLHDVMRGVLESSTPTTLVASQPSQKRKLRLAAIAAQNKQKPAALVAPHLNRLIR